MSEDLSITQLYPQAGLWIREMSQAQRGEREQRLLSSDHPVVDS